MKKAAKTRGRPRISPLTRAEQLRAAKNAQRHRERRAGLATVQLRLPADQAGRLRVAANSPKFREALDKFLCGEVLDIKQWPMLHDLVWNRAGSWILAEDALAMYERHWRFVEPARLSKDEANLIEQLKNRFGGGVLNV